MLALGKLVASGRTSEVFEYGNDSVVKVPRRSVPAEWAAHEAQMTRAVRTCGVAAPEVRDVVTVDGRDAIVFERIHGPSMWAEMLRKPDQVAPLARELADVHREIQRAGLPDGIPDQVDRCCLKLSTVTQLTDAERAEACDIVRALPRGAALLHGDLHPGNVLLGANGPIVIDWFDAAIGHPIADIIRSTIIIRPPDDDRDLAHLPDAPAGVLTVVLCEYIDRFNDVIRTGRRALARWEAVLAASRIAERADLDEAGLLGLWSMRNADAPSPALAAR